MVEDNILRWVELSGEVSPLPIVVVFGITFLLLIIVLISTAILSITGHVQTNETKVPCYDKWGNEIIDIECIEKVQCSSHPMSSLSFYGKCGQEKIKKINWVKVP